MHVSGITPEHERCHVKHKGAKEREYRTRSVSGGFDFSYVFSPYLGPQTLELVCSGQVVSSASGVKGGKLGSKENPVVLESNVTSQ
jgi:hypothetical protein